MSGVSPAGLAENGTRSGKAFCNLLFMGLVFSNLPSCLPSLASGLIPAGQRYYEGSEFCQPLQRISSTTAVSLSQPTRSLVGGAWNWGVAPFLSALVNDGYSAVCNLADLPAYLD